MALQIPPRSSISSIPVARPNVLAGGAEAGLVSAIVPTYNRASLVIDAVASLSMQDYRNIEIIVVDDGSNDETLERLDEWGQNRPEVGLEVISQPNSGVATARNAGLAKAKGEFIYFLDSDDLVLPDALPKLVDALEHTPDAPFAVGRVSSEDMQGNPIKRDRVSRPMLSTTSIFENQWLINAALYRRTTLQKSGQFIEGLRNGEDSELRWRIVASNGTGIEVDADIAIHRHHNLGHLSLHKDSDGSAQSSIEASAALADWMDTHSASPQRMPLRRLASLAGLGIKAGAQGDDAARRKAFALPGSLSRKTPVANKLIGLIGSPSSQSYYSLALSLFKTGKIVRAQLAGFRRTLGL
ncbi:MAG: glycosyltransferase family A protein [Pseudomonadota bacterium]